MSEKSEQEIREKQTMLRELKAINTNLEKLVVRLTSMQSLNEASYLRKAVTEIKRSMRTL
jgi:predicted PhzF superfamily epimerase YddE/YHI9